MTTSRSSVMGLTPLQLPPLQVAPVVGGMPSPVSKPRTRRSDVRCWRKRPSIRKNCDLLKDTRLKVVNTDAILWLKKAADMPPFDIIFLDPPYDQALLPECAKLIAEKRLLAPGGIVYMESSSPLDSMQLPGEWHLLKSKKVGQVYYGVCEQVID